MIVSIVIVVLWGLFYSYSKEKYDQQYAIFLTALLVASIAAVANLLSLQWSRDTIRPFLSLNTNAIHAEVEAGYVRIEFTIFNSGSLPATEMDVDIDFFASDEEVTEDNLSGKYSSATKSTLTPMILPNNNYIAEYIFDLKNKDDLKLWEDTKQGNVIVRLRISYQSLSRKHVTIQTERICGYPWEKGLIFEPIPPQKWK